MHVILWQNHAVLVTTTFLYGSRFLKWNLAILGAMFAAILNIMPSKTLVHKWKTTVRLSKYSQCPLTSNYIKIFANSIYYNDYSFFGGHLGRHLEFLKTLKGAKPAPDGILNSIVSPLRKYQNIYYTLPCHVGLKYIKYLPDYNILTTDGN